MPERVTWYAVIPIATRDDGSLAYDYPEAIACRSADEAVQIAARMARKPGYTSALALRSGALPLSAHLIAIARSPNQKQGRGCDHHPSCDDETLLDPLHDYAQPNTNNNDPVLG